MFSFLKNYMHTYHLKGRFGCKGLCPGVALNRVALARKSGAHWGDPSLAYRYPKKLSSMTYQLLGGLL